MDIVFIEQLTLNTIIGIHDWEREAKQQIILDIEMDSSIQIAAKSDNIKDCVDYFKVCERMKQLANEHHYLLVEAFIEQACDIILNEFNTSRVRIKLNKPDAIKSANGVGVIIERFAKNELKQEENKSLINE